MSLSYHELGEKATAQKKKLHFVSTASFRLWNLPSAEAIAAVNRTVVPGLEGNLASLAAFGADSIKQLTSTAGSSTASLLAGHTAGTAALRLVLKTLFGVKFLFAGGENEFLTAVLADECFVVVHKIPLTK